VPLYGPFVACLLCGPFVACRDSLVSIRHATLLSPSTLVVHQPLWYGSLKFPCFHEPFISYIQGRHRFISVSFFLFLSISLSLSPSCALSISLARTRAFSLSHTHIHARTHTHTQYIDGRASRAWRQVQAGVDSCKQVGIDTRLPPPATAPPQAPVQRRGGAHARRKTGEEATQMTRSSPGLSQGHTPGQHKGRDDNAESQGRECNAAHPHPPSHGKGKREEAVEKERTRSWWNSVQDTVGSGPWNTCNPPQMAAGGVGAALVEGAAFVFLQPVHKGNKHSLHVIIFLACCTRCVASAVLHRYVTSAVCKAVMGVQGCHALHTVSVGGSCVCDLVCVMWFMPCGICHVLYCWTSGAALFVLLYWCCSIRPSRLLIQISHVTRSGHGWVAGTFGGMEDHLITNHAYLLALHFEAQVFRQGHLSLWHRVTLRPIPPLHHLLPIPTAGAVHVAALKEATASAAFSWLKTKIARGKVHHTQVARGKVHHFQGAHLGGGDARPSGRGTSQTKTHGTSQTNTPASSQTPSRSQRSQTRTSSLTLPPAPNPLSHHPLAPATNILDEGVGTLGPLASHVSPASDVPLASDTPVQALASHTLGLGPFGLHRLGPLALDGLRLGPLAVVLPSAHEHAAEGTLCRATQDSSSCWDVVGVETGAVDALFAVDTPLPAAPNPFLEHVAVGSGPASRTSASERPMPAGTGPQIVPVTDAIARDGTRDGTRHSRASRLMHLSRL